MKTFTLRTAPNINTKQSERKQSFFLFRRYKLQKRNWHWCI